MNPNPHFAGDDETVCFDADIHGNPVRIEVIREIIEDCTRAESMSADERLAFVKRNRAQIIANVENYLRAAPDVTGFRITEEQLAGCA